MAKLKYNLDDIQDFNLEAGKYRAKLTKVEQTLSSTKKPMLVWYWKIASGSEKGKEIRSYTSLVESALSNLKNHLMAFKLSGRVNMDTAKLVGRYAIIIVALSTSTRPGREGLTFSNVAAVNPDKGANADLDDDDVEDEDEVEDEDDVDEDEDDEEDEEVRPARKAAKIVSKPAPKRKAKVVEEDEDEDEDEEDEEEDEDEEPVKPVRKGVARKVIKHRTGTRLPF